ncbi:MAG: hybrid sensor histidine kinase/response regulator, partial [Lachnospiraceae bacterium]|nr:hybrid sensor histidine kinase/response regulator [Lachnospiraceae bacterium]
MGEKCTLFTSTVMDQWHVVIVVRNKDLFADAYSQLTVNILVSLTIFVLVTIFYFIGYKNEQAYGKKVEEMKSARQKQQYEADVLRLEKASADEANKAKSNFLADMSHEIRTPINAILGMNEMILRETKEDSIREYSGNIRNSGKNLLQLVNSILDFSKIEDG